MSQVTSPVILDSTGQDIVTQLAAISAAIAADTVITANTDTTLAGVLQGANGKVAVMPVDNTPTDNSTNLVSSGGTDKAIKGRVPVYGLGKNLLDNWDFLNPVNQRGATSGAEGYSIDRWLVSYGSGGVSWSLTSNGLTFQPTNASSYGYICQVIGNEILSALTGKKISVYVLTSDGDVIGGVVTYTSDVLIYDATYDGHRVRIRFAGSDFRIESYASALTVCAVKLELGSEQTLCHNEGTDANPVWVMNDVPDYEYELYRCMTSTADSSDTYANKTLATGQEIAYVENGITASRAYAVGEYFCWHGSLYKAKTVIGNGDTFTVNTNCEQVSEGGVNFITKLLNFFGTNEKSAQTDLDTLLESGIYFSNAWINSPSFDTNRNGTVIVVRRSGNNLVQIYIPTLIGGDLNGIAMRNRTSNQSFTSWFKFSCTTV